MDCAAILHSLDTDTADDNSWSERKPNTLPNASRSKDERDEAEGRTAAADEEAAAAEDAKPAAGGDEPDMLAAEGQQWRKESEPSLQAHNRKQRH